MADVANCLKPSTPGKANFGQMLSDVAEDILSPEVREAMDRIFPQSASQFLQGGLSFEEDPFLSIASDKVDKNLCHAKHPSASTGSPDFVAMSSIATAKVTAGLINAVSVAPAIPSFRNSLPVTVEPSVVASDSNTVAATAAAPADSSKPREQAVEPDKKSTELPKKLISKIRITKADFEILTSCDALINDYERASRTSSNVDNLSDSYRSGGGSDSEDMSRPFASITREKKKKKRRKRQASPHPPCITKTVNYLSEHNVNSGDEFQISSKSWTKYTNAVNMNGSGDTRPVLENDFAADKTNQSELMSSGDLGNKRVHGCSQSDYSSHSNGYRLDICPGKDVYKYSVTASEDISNTSNSSAKENLDSERHRSRQTLPKIKRDHFHIVRHVNKIKNAFPPCYVVLRKINSCHVYNVNNFNVSNSVLPLKSRVKCLKDLCNQGYLVCKKNRRVLLAEKLGYLNFFQEALLHSASEDEFEKPQGRSLRKRAKNISYVEPCEDDIVEEFSSKRSSVKCKDDSLRKSSHESVERKQDSSVADSAVCQVSSSDKYKQCFESSSHKSCSQDLPVYTSSSLSSASVYNPCIGKNTLAFKEGETSQQHMYSPLNNHKTSNIPFLPYFSGLSGGTGPGVFPHATSFFSPLPLNFSGNLDTHSYIEQAPFSYAAPNLAQSSHQLDFMKMSSKDVYMPMLPPSAIGVAGMGPSLSSILPTRNPMGMRTGPNMFSQPLPQVNSNPYSAQTMFVPPLPAVSVIPRSAVSAASTQLSSLYGLPFLNRQPHSSSQNISLAALPVLSPPHIASCMESTVAKPLPHISYGAPNLTSILSPPGTIAASSSGPTRANILSSPSNLYTITLPVSLNSPTSLYTNTLPVSLNSPTSLYTNTLPVSLSSPASSYASTRPVSFDSPTNLYTNKLPVSLSSAASSYTSTLPVSLSSAASSYTNTLPVSLSSAASSYTNTLPVPLRPLSMPFVSSVDKISLSNPSSHSRLTNLSSHHLRLPKPSHVSENLPVMPNHIRENIPSPNLQSKLPCRSNQSMQLRLATIPNMVSPQRMANISSFPNPQPSSSCQPVSAFPVRAVVPGVPADTGDSGCAAILRSLATASLSPHQSTINAVLPRLKRLSDHEQRAAKRRKLEERYPLPPGVIIKTERLDSPELSSENAASQRLLSQNSQLSAVVPIQSSEIISCLSTSGISVNSSQSSRSVSGQTLMGSKMPSVLPGAAGSYPLAAAATARNIDSCDTNSTSNPFCIPIAHSHVTEMNSVSACNPTAGLVQPRSSSFIESSVSSSFDIAAGPPPSPAHAVTPASSSVPPAVPESHPSHSQQQYTPRSLQQAAALNRFKNSLGELHILVQRQELAGLRGDRLEKLKKLLCMKQIQFREMQKLVDMQTEVQSANRQSFGGGEGVSFLSREHKGGSETDPFVID